MNNKWFQFAFALLGVFLLIKLGFKMYERPNETGVFDFVRIALYLFIIVTSYLRFNQINRGESNQDE